MNRILFIGNSHTYLHYMPQLLAGMANSKGKTVTTEQLVGEGVSLAWHSRRPETRGLIEEGYWTHVVLQERSRGSLEDKISMHHHARHLDQRIREAGARTVFFMTWAARGQAREQDTIADAYQDIALECGAMLAPVGKAWELALAQNGCPNLYHRDGRHAGKIGAYLSACVFYTLLCGDAIGLGNIVEEDGRVLVDLADKDASLLQQAARDSVLQHGIS